MQAALPVYYLDGESLTPEMVYSFVNVLILQLMELGYRKYKLDLSAEAWAKVDVCCFEGFSYVQSGRQVVDDIVANKITKYGINYQDYDKTLLSTKVGIIELDKINSYINNKSLKQSFNSHFQEIQLNHERKIIWKY